MQKMTAQELLATKNQNQNTIYSLKPTDSLFKASEDMKTLNCGLLLVLEEDRLVGVVSERDIVRRGIVAGLNPKSTPVSDIMTKDVACVYLTDTIEKCYETTSRLRCRHLPVRDSKQKMIGVLSTNDIVTALMKEHIAEGKKRLEVVLNNLAHGLMVFNADGVIQPGCSKICETFFNINPDGKKFIDVLNIQKEAARSSVDSWIFMMFEEIAPFNDIAPMGPRVYLSPSGAHIELEYRPIKDGSGKLTDIICIARDATYEIELKKKISEQQAFVNTVMSIINNRQAFHDFVNQFRGLYKEIQKVFSQADAEVDIASLTRHVHTIKGSAALFYLDTITSIAHELETELSQIKGTRGFEVIRTFFVQNITQLKDTLEKFISANISLVGKIGEPEERVRELPTEKITKISNALKQSLGAESPIYKQYIEEIVAEPIVNQFARYNILVNRIAEKLDKEVDYIVNPSDIRLPVEPYSSLFSSLVHLFKNAIDHGIEKKEIRDLIGKSPRGKIEVSVQDQNNDVIISVRDDGGGIDVTAVRNKIRVLKLLSEVEISKISDEEIMQYIFSPGLSTKEEVTTTSGRGVGLDAVKYQAKQLGGDCWVSSVKGKGTEFFIKLPRQIKVSTKTY